MTTWGAGLTVREHMTLQLAGQRFAFEGVRVTRARDELGYSETRFWQVVDALLEHPGALAAHPSLVRRLQRVRDARRAARSGRAAS
ncbi:DUF3263 domain-containing protein [Nocardioides lijunqiniae]|uniref:DUF3263 domain-containing protein n=1 Tax=Nocardioides lijunqiniae TaxID=2760832 RepID=UPI001878A208|nr:DUF3263 domain-containing protein [Nocardioides lijunqiniae]